jgi:hypothetical protein
MAKKDVFDLFKEQSEKLECPPTPQAWGRIERRIQSSRPVAQRSRMRSLPRPLGIAAGLALLLGLSVVFMWLTEQKVAGPLAQSTESSFVLEERPLALEESAVSDVELLHTHVKITPQKPIVEGTSTQRLVAKNEVPQERNQTRPSPSVDTTERRTGK